MHVQFDFGQIPEQGFLSGEVQAEFFLDVDVEKWNSRWRQLPKNRQMDIRVEFAKIFQTHRSTQDQCWFESVHFIFL